MSGSWKAVAFYPPSWVAIAAVVLAVVAILVVLEPSTLPSIVVVAVGVVAVIVWPITLSATGTLDRLRARAPEPQSVSEADVSILRDQLDRLDDSRPGDQLYEIRKKRDEVVTLLDRRRQAGDLVYERYRPAAEQVYMAVITNLREVLADTSTPPSGSPSEAAAPADTEMDPLAQNDGAIAAMDRASSVLGSVTIGMSTREATAALEALRELADRPGT